MRYVVDTNVFNRICDKQLSKADLGQDIEFVATEIQRQQINKTPNTDRRAELNRVFDETAPEMVRTETGIWGAFTWGASKWSNGIRMSNIKAKLDAKGRRKDNLNDALIGEVALANGYGLITADRPLYEVMTELNVKTIFIPPITGDNKN